MPHLVGLAQVFYFSVLGSGCLLSLGQFASSAPQLCMPVIPADRMTVVAHAVSSVTHRAFTSAMSVMAAMSMHRSLYGTTELLGAEVMLAFHADSMHELIGR